MPSGSDVKLAFWYLQGRDVLKHVLESIRTHPFTLQVVGLLRSHTNQNDLWITYGIIWLLAVATVLIIWTGVATAKWLSRGLSRHALRHSHAISLGQRVEPRLGPMNSIQISERSRRLPN
jgi:hypothetical protein